MYLETRHLLLRGQRQEKLLKARRRKLHQRELLKSFWMMHRWAEALFDLVKGLFNDMGDYVEGLDVKLVKLINKVM